MIQGCTIEDNAASHVGGAIYATGPPPRIYNSSIINNRVWSPDGDWYRGRGGAIYGAAEFDHCVIANNWAEHLGGAINARDAGIFTVSNCTFFGNLAGVDGSCAHFDAATHPTFVNTIVASHGGNSNLYCWGVANPKFQNCDVWGNSAGNALCGTDLGGNISQDPLFCDPSAGDYQLDVYSPCVGTGVPDSGPRNIGALGVGCWECDCDCHADPYCDQQTDIIDVILAADIAFRSRHPIYDSSCSAHSGTVGGRTDFDCSGYTDILDVIKVINVAFHGANAATEYCEPCE